jgi:hypothetical protein
VINRGDQDAEEKIKFDVPAGYRIWILQPKACTEVVETIPVDSEKRRRCTCLPLS